MAKLNYPCERASRLEGGLNVADVGRSGQTIKYREAIGEDPGAKGTEQDVFESGFVGTLFATQETGEDVEAESHGLEAEKLNDQVDAGSHEHHPNASEEKKRVVLAFLFVFDLQIFHGQKNYESGGGQEEGCEKKEEWINDDRVLKPGEIASGRNRAAQPPQREGAEDRSGQRHASIQVFFFLLDPEIDHQDA